MKQTPPRHPALDPQQRLQTGLPGILGLLATCLFVLSLLTTRGTIDADLLLDAWLNGRDSIESMVLLQLRLPRAALALLIGASLGLAGAAMQGLLRNPLAEPGIVGVSGCAAFGAVLMFYSGLAGLSAWLLPAGGIAGAFAAVALLYALAGANAGTVTLILAGVAINAFAGAATALALNLAANPFAIMEILFWQLGSLADRSLADVLLIAPLTLGGWVLLLSSARGLEALTLGEDSAVSLGINLSRLRLAIILGTALAVGSAVAISGLIGFVGLVVPHLLRPLVGYHPGRLLPASMLGGASLLLAADIAVQLIPTGTELKVGVLTALIGAPFFLALVRSLRNEGI